MDQTRPCAILFVDLRGSTSMYFRLGNAEAASLVTACLSSLVDAIRGGRGRVVKTLGDGLLAVFDEAERAVEVAAGLQDVLERRAAQGGKWAHAGSLKLKVSLAWGDVVEVDDDCFGDALNVAARLQELASDNEILITGQLLRALPSDQQERFRNIDWLHLRGRAEPVQVLKLDNQRAGDTASTEIMEGPETDMPDGLRLTWLNHERIFPTTSMPLSIGRSPQASFCVGDARVSRSHVRIEAHSGHIYLTDQSHNGTHVRFDHDEHSLTLRRSTCMLHGSGVIILGAPSSDPTGTQIRFDVLSFSDTLPQ